MSQGKKFSEWSSKQEEWNVEETLLGKFDEIWFTDGFKTNDRVGAAYMKFNLEKHWCKLIDCIALGKFLTVFQSEVIAIENCARKTIRRN